MKVLVISHNPVSSNNNMGKTMLSLFSCFTEEELCQFYIYPTFPDVRKCTSYYRITDKEALKNIVFGKDIGREIQTEEISFCNNKLFENAGDEKLYRNIKNKLPFRMSLRDVMWKCAHWFGKRLRKWIEKQKPTCIFFAPGDAKFIYEITLKIAKKYKLPIITYICDDYYFVEKTKGFLKKIQVNSLRKEIKKIIEHTANGICICDEIKDRYTKHFSLPCTTIMTGASFEISDIKSLYRSDFHDPLSMVYLGNIRCKRYVSLIQIGKVLEEITRESGKRYKLKIYTPEKEDEILKPLKEISTIQLCGFVSGQDYLNVLCSAEILVHTESFDPEMIDLVKSSISTKIADSLASGRKIFAYGAEEVASIKYLKSTGGAYVSTSSSTLKEIIIKAFQDTDDDVIRCALNAANINHNARKNSEVVHELCCKLSGEKAIS